MMDDRTGRPKTSEEVGATTAVLDLFAAVAAKNEAVKARFIAMVVAAGPEEAEAFERGFVGHYEMLLPGEGGDWVRDIYRRARAIRGQTQ